jgi:hypothetical protein
MKDMKDFDPSTQVAFVWSVVDVQSVCPSLTTAEARAVLQACQDNHNAECGMNWSELESQCDVLFPLAEQYPDDDAA